jgi:hypothetical protein
VYEALAGFDFPDMEINAPLIYTCLIVYNRERWYTKLIGQAKDNRHIMRLTDSTGYSTQI